MTIPAIRPAHFPYFPYEGFTFSLGRHDGEQAWLSGHSGATWDDGRQKMTVGGGMGEQATTMYEKIGTILAGAGLGFGDVVHIVENVTAAGLDSYPEADEVRRKVFGGHEPALTTVIVDRLVRRAALIEVQVTAHRGGGTTVTAGPSGRWRRTALTEAGGVVHLPTLLPLGEDGEVVAPGDFRGQYRYCLERAGTLLAAAGLSLANVVKTVDYSTPATREVYPRTDRPRRELLGPVHPAAAGILMTRMPVPGALVALDVTASREPLELVNPGWARYDTLSYSPGVRAGRFLFMSGFAALDMATQVALFPGDLAAQAEHAYGCILELLAHAGGSAEDLVETIEYVTPEGVPGYRAVAEVRGRLLRPPWPASVGAVCGGLLRPEFMLEVVPTAVLAP
ncbi:MAG TPA: RidA family protein [Streptosporangiaceae bacterium]|nr:RidA family protein [Streptosporangiaceae bacterium]